MLKKFWLICSCFVGNFAYCTIENDPYELAIFGGEPRSVVDGCVNVITGDYFIAEDDWVIPGQEPIVIQRKYLSRHSDEYFGGWEFFFNHLKVDKIKVPVFEGCHLLRIPEKQGFHLMYLGEFHKKRYKYSLIDACTEALTNCYAGEINARLNAFNNYVSEDPDNQDVISVKAADGTSRTYRLLDKKQSVYYLIWESLPNTNRIHYHWDDVYGEKRLKKIVTTDASAQKHYATATIDYVFGDNHQLYSMTISDAKNGGRNIRYQVRCDEHEGKKYWNICKIDHPSGPDEKFNYWQVPKGGLSLSFREVGEGRQLKIHQYSLGRNELVYGDVNITRKDERYRRVKWLMQPLGEGQELQRAYEFVYEPGKYKKGPGATIVYDAQRNPTYYYYNLYFLLTEVKKCTEKNSVLLRETYDWYPYIKGKGSWLKGKSLYDENGKHVYSYNYVYDSEKKGNLVQESFTGDLTGQGLSEAFVIKREFHENNLIFREIFPNGKVFEYHYVPGTNLLEKKFIFDGSELKLRHFYYYQGSALIKEVTDNGSSRDVNCLSGVTQRKLKKVVLRKTEPFLDFPDVIEESYFDLQSNQEILLSRKKILHYNSMGRPAIEEYSDANGDVRYTIEYEYDSKERLSVRIDPEGNKRILHYDANGNIFLEDKEDEAFVSLHDYDFSNRLLKTTQSSAEGKQREVHFKYNSLHHKIEETDVYGQTTFYENSPLGKPVMISLPPLEDGKGNLNVPRIKRLYNALGKVIWEKNPEGNETITETTSRGLPKRIGYADGTEERYTYDLNGNVATYLSPGGTKTVYAYDFLDRIISKQVYFDGELLSKESFHYDAFHLRAHEHPDGVVTTYTYDGAGRKIEETTADHTTQFSYDTLGRLHKVITWNDNNIARILVKEYDLLDRVVEEKEEDQNGQSYNRIEYYYDQYGNLAETVHYRETLNAVEILSYDCFKRIVRKQDPMGYVTTIAYNETFKNDAGQTVLQTVTTNPKNHQTIETYNTHGKIARMEKFSSEGHCLLREEYFYNLNNQKVKQVSTLFDPDKTIVTTWKYDCRGRMIELREGVGTEFEKITGYTYTPDGQRQTLIKPDGTVLTSTYDGLGRQRLLESSDGTLKYAFAYDAMGFLIEACDCHTHKVTKRTYDHFGNLQQETLANGQTLSKAYDALNRATSLTYGDGSQTIYSYDAYHLVKIQRLPKIGISYTHSYQSYDLQHHLKEELLPCNLGTVEHLTDQLGRRFSTLSPYSHELISEFDPTGNVCAYTYLHMNQERSNHYHYNALDQLTQELGSFSSSFHYDSHHNRIAKNNITYHLNPLHELEGTGEFDYEQDLNGNRIAKYTPQGVTHYHYDVLDRLIEIITPLKRYVFSYDPLNRLLDQKIFVSHQNTWSLQHSETYLYDDKQELGAFPHELRILGLGKGAEIGATIAIEKEGFLLVPLHDLFGNIVALIDAKTHKVAEEHHFSAFGETNRPLKYCPWGYQSKRHIHDLVFFGRRLYDPEIGRWLSPDPQGFSEGPNLYQFLLNNPFSHIDLYGEKIGIRIWEIACNSAHAGLGLVHGGLDSVVTMGFLAMDLGVLSTTLLMYDGKDIRSNYFSIRQNLMQSYESALQNYLGGSDNYHYQEWRQGTHKGIEFGLLATGIYAIGKKTIASEAQLALGGMKNSPLLQKTNQVSYSGSYNYEISNSSNYSLNKSTRLNKLIPHPEARGHHTSFKLDPSTMKVIGYETYDIHPITGKWYAEIRFRGIGKPHGNFKPPFILERQPGKGPGATPIVPRKPEPWELPYGYE